MSRLAKMWELLRADDYVLVALKKKRNGKMSINTQMLISKRPTIRNRVIESLRELIMEIKNAK